jgi:hypothetical protein
MARPSAFRDLEQAVKSGATIAQRSSREILAAWKRDREELEACRVVFACDDCKLTVCDEHEEQLAEGLSKGAD